MKTNTLKKFSTDTHTQTTHTHTKKILNSKDTEFLLSSICTAVAGQRIPSKYRNETFVIAVWTIYTK